MLGFTALCLFFGFLLGLMRGRNRSVLRLILVVLSAVAAVAFKDVVVEALMNYEYQGQTINALISSLFTDSGVTIPDSIQSLIFTLIEIIIGVVVFFLIFFVLKFISWLILFPILKIFVRRGKKKRVLIGGLIGLIQGAVVAFVVCAPLTGLVSQVNQISEIKLQGNNLFTIPEEVGVAEYIDSTPAKIYGAAGGWFYDMVTSKKNAEGKNVSISAACDVINTVASIADTFTTISSDLSAITSGDVTPQTQVDTIKKLGDSLIKIGDSVDSLDADSKEMVQDLIDGVKEMVAGEAGELPPEVETALDQLDINNLKLDSAGKALNGIATYIEKTSDEFENSEPVTQEEVDQIVSGLVDNTFLLDVITGENETPQIVEINEENKAKFEASVNAANASEEDKETIRKLFGLSE